ncbi:MAG: hypothetical protein FJ399_17050, partial [Verrucomicrobia bacterium]|nr:hypothetical protein [Verrucomicrobiota bacterium]
ALRAEREQNELREAARQAQLKEIAARQSAEVEQLRAEKQRWVRQQVLPEIERLLQTGEAAAAFALAVEAEKHLPDDPALAALRPRVAVTTSIDTTPAGAEILWKPYRTPKAEWQSLGRSPLKEVRLARDMLRLLVRLEGHEPLERATANNTPNRTIHWSLDRVGEVPSGMVRVPGRSVEPGSADATLLWSDARGNRTRPISDFFLDRHEVTNRQFKAFVDRGGYDNPAWWKQSFVKDGKELSRIEAMALLRDSTGRPGPATWKDGAYPQGDDDHPVAGVSWFEAAAYAESVGRRLPTIHHWDRAAGWGAEYLVRMSNFSGQGPVAVGTYQGMSTWGAYDLAGNVKEWCWNEAVNGRRYILGADSREPAYMFTHRDAQPPWDRSAMNGFRCISLPPGSTVDPGLEAAAEPSTRDFFKEQPVSDEVFRAYRDMYAYEKTPLDARVETVDETLDWARREKVTVNAAYGDERLPVWVYLPKRGTPPYQAVVYFPGSGAMNQRDRVLAEPFFVESGRALIVPVFKGLYERGEGPAARYLNDSNLFSDFVIQCAKDLGRTVDYLETRSDIRADKIAYFGTSLGAAVGSVLLGVESRVKAAVLVSGGINPRVVPPQVDQINFAPRIRMPTLMLNGRYDFIFTEPSQQQLFRLLGAAPEHKLLVTVELGHVVRTDIRAKETLAWLDRYLGPVK